MLIIIILLVVVGLGYITLYNGLVKGRLHAQEAWSQIDVQLKRRNDLIPNLVDTVKGYSDFEKTTLEEVVALRNQLLQVPVGHGSEKLAVSDQLTGSLQSLFAVAEGYPDLKANQTYLKLMEELTNTENKIAYSRQLFNATTASYNMKLQTFPSSIVANLHHFQPSNFLQVDEADKALPTVSLNDK
ncbi:MAG: LemA family protein [Lactobacillaceae bacterium]|jgi:LemA protein|nr:LemA family protein [Lactobacillaceae bacterium]